MKDINWEHTRCQEASLSGMVINDEPVPCGRPGAMVIWHNNDGRNVYVMCEMCGDHNIRNRGGIKLAEKPYTPTFKHTMRNYFVQMDAAELEMRTIVHLMEEAGMEILEDEAIATEAQRIRFEELYKEKYGTSFIEKYSAKGEL